LVPIADEVLREVHMLDEEREIDSTFPDESVYVSADPALIKQLIRILVDNSLKYTPADGEIKLAVSIDREARLALVTVEDEGGGIPEEVLPHIFDRFVRADEARTRDTGGAGLGLSIAKQIAERHGGSLDVVSSEGIGTRFTIILSITE